MRRIGSKQEFYQLSRRHELGNYIRCWGWDEFFDLHISIPSPLPWIVGVRHVRAAFTNKGNSGLFKRPEAIRYCMGLPLEERRRDIILDEGAVHDHITIQGELMADERGLYVRYSHLQCHQRTLWHIDQFGLKGLKRFQWPHNMGWMRKRLSQHPSVVDHARGLLAVGLLDRYMDFDSREKMKEILCAFHYPIVEFACFDKPLGTLGWNTIFWEVRTNY